ncbi:MAG: NUDIX hydrolase [Chitinophagales bacterium]|nr:NUDIX hydrolase [Chitinophagales bacterium]
MTKREYAFNIVATFVKINKQMPVKMLTYRSRIQQDDLYSIPISDFFQSAFSVDCVIFGYHEGELKVLLIERGTEPYKNFWALPGDLVYPNEDLNASALRILKDLTSLTHIDVKQVHTFGRVDRHPLGRVITVAYLALVETQDLVPVASSWASKIKWHTLYRLPKLAFDHREILDSSLDDLRKLIKSEPIWTKVLPEKFTLTQLQLLFETVLNKQFDKGNFRKKIRGMKFLKKLNESEKSVAHRPSIYYKFDQPKFNEQKDGDYVFDL